LSRPKAWSKKFDKDSAQLRIALETGKSIIITTLQKFPVISESMTQLKGRRFAVIIDEAHSSQSGESAKHLKKTLSVNLEQAEEEDKTEEDIEDKIIAEIRTRGPQNHISYFAFTATPKNKTLELLVARTMTENSSPITSIPCVRPLKRVSFWMY
jgi:type I restriction enzyme, R subunit